ncbi:hypothetical protein [Trinickia sp. EG282A]|uniref:hypothetical protein n=1 Tax=Trinickia sp. EG282A TaxID=3237013 RepID=UPI0034D199C7
MSELIDRFRLDRAHGAHVVMTFLVLAYGLVNLFFGEVVPAGGGLGWDGVVYASIVRNLWTMISHGQMTGYYAQRLLPSVIVRGMLIVSGAEFTNGNIIRAFDLYNLTLLLFATIIWKRIADSLELSIASRWVGFGGIFVNFLIAKQVMYAPVSTDVTAMVISMLLLLFYLQRRPFALLFTMVAGSFVWQITGLCGALLMVFMHARFSESEISGSNVRSSAKRKFKRAALFLWMVLITICVFAYIALPHMLSPEQLESEGGHKLERLIAGLPSLIAVVVAVAVLLGSIRLIGSVASKLAEIPPGALALAVAGVLIPHIIVRSISNPGLPNANSFSQVLEWVVFPLNGEGKFLMPLVTLSVFWGPALLLMIIVWDQVCVELRRLGPGAMAIVGLNMPLALVTEPRYVIGAWPFVITALVLALQKRKRRNSFPYAFLALSVASAQFWLPMNLRPWTGADVDGLLEFPKQLLFMHYGPWMSWSSYLIQLAVVLLSAAWLRGTLLIDEKS